MGLKADQERVRTLLTETITLLCKNGLNFHTEFSIEGLIGVTLDREEIFLVSISETIKSTADTVRSTSNIDTVRSADTAGAARDVDVVDISPTSGEKATLPHQSPGHRRREKQNRSVRARPYDVKSSHSCEIMETKVSTSPQVCSPVGSVIQPASGDSGVNSCERSGEAMITQS